MLAHQDRIYSIALRMLGDPRDAEEAAQDAFVRAYRALAGYDAAAHPGAPPPAVAGHDRAQPVPLAARAPAGGRPDGRSRSTSRCRASWSRGSRRRAARPRSRPPEPRPATGPSSC